LTDELIHQSDYTFISITMVTGVHGEKGIHLKQNLRYVAVST